MYIKVTQSGARRYVQLVESYRDDTGRVKKRTLANLGRLDRIQGDLSAVIRGLQKIAGVERSVPSSSPLRFDSARAMGDVWALNELWNALGFGQLRSVFAATRHQMDVEGLLRVMIFNRLCNPNSKLGVLRWLETVAFPDLQSERISHQH